MINVGTVEDGYRFKGGDPSQRESWEPVSSSSPLSVGHEEDGYVFKGGDPSSPDSWIPKKDYTPEGRTIGGTLKDVGISALKSAISVPETAVGLADIVTGGAVGNIAEKAGVRFKEAKAILDENLSPAQKEANRKVAEAEGFVGTAGAMLENPSTIGHSVIESAASMGAGGVIGRGVMAAVPKIAPLIAGAIGEGVVGAGAMAESVRQETGGLTGGQSMSAIGSGAGTALFSVVGGRIANRLGIADVDTLLVKGGSDLTEKGVIRRMVEGGISEGAFEELPQSAQEQVWQNAAMGKPLLDGVPEAAAAGLLTGGVMGGGANILARKAPEPADILDAPDIDTAIETASASVPLVTFPDGSTMTRAEAEQRRLDSMVQTAETANAPGGSFGQMDEFATLLSDERADLQKRRSTLPTQDEFDDLLKSEQIDLAYLRRDAIDKANAERLAEQSSTPDLSLQNEAVAKAEALTRAQGFDDPTPTAMQLAMQDALARRRPPTEVPREEIPQATVEAAAAANPVATQPTQPDGPSGLDAGSLPAAVEPVTPAFSIATTERGTLVSGDLESAAPKLREAGISFVPRLMEDGSRVLQISQKDVKTATALLQEKPDATTNAEGPATMETAPANIPETPPARPVAPEGQGTAGDSDQSTEPLPVKIAASRNPAPIMIRKDIVGAIMRATRGRGIAADMALTITGDSANNVTRLRGLFQRGGVQDMDDIARMVRDEEGFDVKDGSHLEELVRQAAAGDRILSMRGQEEAQSAEEEARHREWLFAQAEKRGIRTRGPRGGLRQFSAVEAEYTALMDKRQATVESKLEERARRAYDAMIEEARSTIGDDRLANELDAAAENLPFDHKARDFYSTVTKHLKEVIYGIQPKDVGLAERSPEGRAGESNRIGGAEADAQRDEEANPPAVPEASAEEGRPALDLVTQTPEELAQKAARENDQAIADRERIKAESEATAPFFSLTQETKPIEVAEQENRARQTGLGLNTNPTLDNSGSDATLARTKDRNEVRFQTPYVGKTGVKLTGYVWPNKKEEYIDRKGEDRVRTVSDWERAVVNLETGRQIVHQFTIELQDGVEREVSAETAARLLGISESTVRSSAKNLLEKEISREKNRQAERADADKIDAIKAADSPSAAIENDATTYSTTAPMIQRMIKNGRGWSFIENRIERESARNEKYRFLVRDGKYIWSPESVKEGSELERRGWRTVEKTAGEIWPRESSADPTEYALKKAVVDYMNGDIDRPELIDAAVASKLPQGTVRALTNRLGEDSLSNNESDEIQRRINEPPQQTPADAGVSVSGHATSQADAIEPAMPEVPVEPITRQNELQGIGQEARIQDFGEKIGGARKDTAMPLGPRQLPAKEDDRPSWARKYHAMQIMESPGRIGKPNVGKWQITKDAGGSLKGATKAVSSKVFDTEREALDAIPLAEVSRNHRAYSYDTPDGKKWGIFRNITDRKRALVKGGFDSYESAMKAMATDPASIIEHKFAFPERPWLDRIERAGPVRREGNISTKAFQETFGFRAGEFGNWNMGGDGQEALNHAYDAMMDFAEILGIPPRALSLNGELAIAFGARGTGGKNSAAAHYEPGRAVINLTKIKGAGSLAHEWWHAVDHYFAKNGGRSDSSSVVAGGFRRESPARTELIDAIKRVVDTINHSEQSTTTDADVIKSNAQKRIDAATRDLDYRLNDLRRFLIDARYRNKKTVATPEQLKQWDAMVEKLRAGDSGEKVYIEPTAQAKRASRFAMGYETTANIRDLNALYKSITGSSFLRSDPSSPGRQMDWMVRSIAENMPKLETKGSVTTNYKGRSEFYLEAKKIDGYRSGDYWSIPEEMGARAFESYVFDKLTADQKRSDYLVSSVENRHYAAFDMKPYPEGEERQRIDAAFDNLFQTIKTRETDKGVALESRAPNFSTESIPDAIVANPLAEEKGADYEAAKAGDAAAAVRLARRLVTPETVEKMRDIAKENPLVVGVSSIEATGKNAIPRAAAEVLAKHLGLDTAPGIVQSNSPKRSAMDGLNRIFNRPEFDGEVEPGRGYVLVDDTLTQGGTFAGMVEHIEANGGHVVGVVALTGKQYSSKLRLSDSLLAEVREKFGDLENEFKQATGYRFDGLTESEARYLARFNKVETVRNRILAEARDRASQADESDALDSRSPSNEGLSTSGPTGSKGLQQYRLRVAQQARDKFLSVFKGTDALDIRVVNSRDEIHEDTRPSPYADGVYYDDKGRIYLIADNITDRAHATRILLHEAVGHYGLSTMMGERFQPLKEAALGIHADGDVTNVQPGDKNWATIEAVRRDYPEVSDDVAAQEVLARMAETPGPTPTLLARAMFHVRSWLRDMAEKMGIKWDWKPEEIRNAIGMANDYMRRGDNLPSEGMGGERGLVYSSMSEPIDAAAGPRPAFVANPEHDGQGPERPNASGSRQSIGKLNDEGKPPLESRATTQPASTWDIEPSSPWKDFVYKFQDKYVDLKDAINAIRDSGAMIGDAVNTYLKEELYHKRVGKRTADFFEGEFKPLLITMQAMGVKREEFEEYLHARHATEANALIRDRGGMDDGGSGMTDKDAADYMAKLTPNKRKQYEALAKRTDAILAKTRETLVEYGLESKETIDGWAKMFAHYVPLHREDMAEGQGIGQGFSVKGSASKHRTGSSRNVADILGNIAQQRDRAIVRGEKNRVAVSLFGLAYTNPNPDIWEAGVVPMIQTVDKNNQIVSVPDPMYKSRDNVIVARLKDSNGQVHDRAIVFNESNARALRMAAALKNLDAANLEGLIGLSGKITRFMAAMSTQYNPVFMFINFARDFQSSAINLSSTPLAGKQKEVMGHALSALHGIYADLRDHRAGRTPTSKWEKLYEEMQLEGGTTGYREMFATANDRTAEQIDKLLDPEWWTKTGWGKVVSAGGLLKAPEQFLVSGPGKALVQWLSDANETAENAMRLAVFKTALDHGLSKEQAASLAKNISVNFNRKGQVGAQMNAAYAFFNAATQGTARIYETLKGPAGKQIIVGGLLVGVAQAMMMAAAGFDDDEPKDFIKERNLIIPLGWISGKKDFFSIPMPLGFHVLPSLGRISAEFAMRGFRKPGKAMGDMVSLLAEAFNPIGSAGVSLQTLMPTPLDPLTALAENKDWTGKTIAKEDFNKLSPTPGHSRAKDTATWFGKSISEALNTISGGTKYTPGWMSPTPDQIDYLIGQATGGVGREVMKAEQTISSTVTGEDLPMHKVPLLGRVYGTTEGQSNEASRFYDNLKKLNEHEAEIKGRRENKEDAAGYIRENPESRLVAYANSTERVVSDLRKRKRKLIEDGASKERIKLIEMQMAARMARFNKRVAEVEQ